MTDEEAERTRRMALSPLLGLDDILRLGRSQEAVATSLRSVNLPRRFEEYGDMLVADGIGSMGSGAMASRLAISTLGGAGRVPDVEIERLRLVDGDCILVCTDGVTASLDDDSIAEVLASPRRLDDQCQDLMELARQRGGEDDITAVIAQYRIPERSVAG